MGHDNMQTTVEPEREYFCVPQEPNDAALLRVIDVLPAAAYTTDAEGLITYFNNRAVELWGREPRLNDPIDRY
jgi:hypothetical protein